MSHIDKTFFALIATAGALAEGVYIAILIAIKREPHSTCLILLRWGLFLVALDGISIAAFLRLARPLQPGIGALWSGWAVLLFSVGAVLCFTFSILFWADRRWNVLSKWEWPKRKIDV
jgi:hypothetical protein